MNSYDDDAGTPAERRAGARLRGVLLGGLSVLALSLGAQAQSNADTDEEPEDVSDLFALDEIVITGTSAQRNRFDTPMATSQFSENDIQRLTYSSQADLLRTVPGINAEGGGGEVAANVFVRGLPSGGQFQFTPLQYDGVPVFSTFGLNSSAFDVYARNDLGIERMEFVRGGVSNLFGAGSVAGIINYISKTGSDESEGTMKVELAEQGRLRGDFAASGPLSSDDNLFYAVSGFYRYDEGPLETGLPSEGYQLRGNIKKEFDDGSGSFTIYGQLIDDSVQFFLPFPLDGDSRKRPLGNDGEKIFTLQTEDARNLSFDTPDGRFNTPIEDGVETVGGSVTFAFEKQLSDGWEVNARGKYASYDHQFNLFLDGDGLVNTPETQGGFLATRGLGDLASASFSFAESGRALAADDLLFANRILDRRRDANDFTGELNLVKSFATGGFGHQVTLGSFFARAEAEDRNYITTFLGEFRDEPRLVDLTVQNPDGSTTIVAQNGLLNANGQVGNNNHIATRYAAYLADQMESDRWVFDLGVRVERIEGDISREAMGSVDIGGDAALAPDLRAISFGTGDFTTGDVSDTEWAIAAGVLYRATDNINVYANASRGFFFPQLRSVQFNEFNEPGRFEAEIIKQIEAGVKYADSRFDLTLSGFYNELSNRANVDFVNDGQGGVVEEVSLQSTETIGIEAQAAVFITEALRFEGNLTLQDHKLTQNDLNPDFIGNDMRRQPDFSYNAGLFYDDQRIDFSVFQTFIGSNFANDGNTVKLASHSIVRLDAGYRFDIGGEQTARLGVGVFNLFDSEGLTEGSPRQANNQSGGGNFFVGRPVLPQRISVNLTFDF